MILMVTAGAGVATGLVIVLYAFFPARPSLAAVIARLEATPAALSPPVQGWRGALGARIVSALPPGLLGTTRSQDLAITGGTAEALATDVALSGLAVLVLVPATFGLAASIHLHAPLTLPLGATLVAAALAAATPLLSLRRSADRARRHFEGCLVGFLDVVVLGMAAGMGVEEALATAAAISPARPYRMLARALRSAEATGESPWEGLGGLAESLGVTQLQELASTLALAGTEGARVRASLKAKAESLRSHALSRAESEANALTEKLFVPGVFLLAGFLVFIGFPAVMRIFQGL